MIGLYLFITAWYKQYGVDQSVIMTSAVRRKFGLRGRIYEEKILMVCEAFGGGVFTYVSQLCKWYGWFFRYISGVFD